ncbi:uncharacterized protein ARMOST_15937 [Armillaria ostoyae]|uniref:Uncharacterized protein n=1 Tax=Armillaria ostoyae TaxID=47428 RepID=A0A284RUU3_ARMOS|nr:uncharacterized protein ARMOST_15937 [Armillaria ostoyae]
MPAPYDRVTDGSIPRDTSRLVHLRHEKHGPIGALIMAVELDPDNGRQIPPWFTLPRRRVYDSRAHRQVTGSLKKTCKDRKGGSLSLLNVARKTTQPPALSPPRSSQTRETWTHTLRVSDLSL